MHMQIFLKRKTVLERLHQKQYSFGDQSQQLLTLVVISSDTYLLISK